MPPRARLLRFTGKAIILLLVFSILWHVIAPYYNIVLLELTERMTSQPIALDDADRAFLFFFDTPLGPGSVEVVGAAFHFGLVLVAVLIAATPGLGFRRRLKLMAIALASLFAIHVLTILIFALIIQSSSTPWRFNGNPAAIFLITLGSQLFPAAIWVVLCYKYWFPKNKDARR